MWSVESDTEKTLRDLLEGAPIVPAQKQKIGASTVEWWEGKPGDAVVMASGGSVEDRTLAEQVVTAQLEIIGYKRAQFTFDTPWTRGGCGPFAEAVHKQTGWPLYGSFNPEEWETEELPIPEHVFVQHPSGQAFDANGLHPFPTERVRKIDLPYLEKLYDGEFIGHPEEYPDADKVAKESIRHLSNMTREAGWPDIEQKAKRLIQSGAVTLLRNGFNNIVAHVIGDHGEYNCEIGRDDPESQAITTWQCFLEDAPITMADGTRKRIDEIKPFDKVISHTGRICDVTQQWFRPYKGKMAVIKLQGIDEVITLTSDHPLWAANQDYYLQDSAGWRGRIKLGEGPVTPEIGWTEAQAIAPGDYLSMAQFMKENEYCVIDGIGINEDIATLLGWYAAEGYVVKSTKNQIGFNLHRDERPIAEMLSKITSQKFGDAGHIRTMRWPSDPDRIEMVEFRVSNADLRLLVETAIGVGSAGKGIHPSLLGAPEKIQRAFLDAYVAGDGNIDGNRARLNTVSEQMAHTLRILLTRLGYPSSLLYEDENDGNGFVKNWRRIYSIRWAIGSKRNNARFMRDGHAWFKVESIDFYDYEGEVYDLEVADDHSFQAFGVNVHNCECPWDQYAWQRTRKWKKYEGRPCAHVLAAYWKSQSTPLDDYNPDVHGPMPGQKMGPAPEPPPMGGGGGGPSAPAGPPLPKPGEAPSTPSPVETPSPAGLAPPGESGVLPKPPMDQLAEQMPPIPGQTPGGMPANPNIVSVPGAKLPTPFNPIQFPGGTYSSAPEDPPNYREGTDKEQCAGCKMNYKSHCWGYGNKQIELDHVCDSWYPNSKESRVAAEEFAAPQTVRLKTEAYGIAEGKSEAHGAGQYRAIPAGTHGEVLGQDPTTGWVEIILPLKDSSYLEPYHVKVFCDPSEIEPVEGSPFVKRHT